MDEGGALVMLILRGLNRAARCAEDLGLAVRLDVLEDLVADLPLDLEDACEALRLALLRARDARADLDAGISQASAAF